VGNPPYNNSQNNKGKKGGGDSLWNKFVVQFITRTKYLVFVHPSGWRKPHSEKSKFKHLFNLMTQKNQMIYLSINGIRKGNQVFGCGTRYDWYIIECTPSTTTTLLSDENEVEHTLDLKKWMFLPNYNFELIERLLGSYRDNSRIVYNVSNYETRKSYVSSRQTELFKYPLVHATNKSGIRYCWSSTNEKGHFGIPKVVFGETGINDVVIDSRGHYGMTQQAMAIPLEKTTDGQMVKRCLLSETFNDILTACSWSNYRIDWRLFTYLKKDFWRDPMFQ